MKWEYLSLAYSNELKIREYVAYGNVSRRLGDNGIKAMNILGSEGWELVAVAADGGPEVLYFKRPLS